MSQSQFPPGPRSALLSYFALRRDQLGFLTDMARRHGDIVHLQVGRRHDFLLNHPDYVKEFLLATEGMARSSPRTLRQLLGGGLLTTDGSGHHRQRRLLQPLFHGPEACIWGRFVVEYTERMSATWRPGQVVDIAARMLEVALAAILRLLFGAPGPSQAAELRRVLAGICELSNRHPFPSPVELLLGIPGRQGRELQRRIAEMDALLYGIIGEARRSNGNGGGVLAALLSVREAPDSPPLTDRQVRDELLTLITAGHETIGNVLAWAWYLLARHPGQEARLHAEVDAVLGGRTPAAEAAPRLAYAQRVLAETMRLYPPVWVFTRRPLRDWPLGGYTIPAGSYVQMSPYVTQRDPRYFPDPERFDPDRWSPKAVAARNRYTYFPFAGGAHRCIGEGLAWTEGVLVLATVARRWRLRLPRGRQQVAAAPRITLRPAGGMPMVAEAR